VHRIELEFAPESTIPEAAIRAAAGVEDVSVSDHTVTCTVRGAIDPLLKALHGANLANMVSHEPSLEEIFLAYYKEDAPSEATAR